MFYSAILLTAVNLLLRMVSTSFQVFLSGRIGAAGIGLLQLVLSVGSLAMTAGMAGVRTATMYLTAEELGKKRPQNVSWVLRSCCLYSLLFSGTLSLGLRFAAPWIAEHWIGDGRILPAIRLYATFLPITCLCGCMTGYFTAANRIGTLAIVEIAEQLCYMVVTMSMLVFFTGNDPALSCQAVVLGSGISACMTLICLIVLRMKETGHPGPKISVRSRLLQTALPLALADDLKAGISTTENLMVPKRLALFPGTDTPLAAFGTVCGMVFPVLMFPACILFALAELLIPELARCAAAGSKTRITYLVQRSLRIALLYGLFCGGLLYLLSFPLCQRLYDSLEAGQYLRLYALLAPMLYCDAITDAMTKGLGQQKACVRYNILTSALDVIFLYFLLPKYGMSGYFVSFLVTHLLNFILSLRQLLKIAGNSIRWHIPVLSALAAVAGVFVAGFAPEPAMRVLGFAGIFFSLLVLLRVLSREDAAWVKGLIRGR